jgi:DNA-binding CsgD family transcriptional regulator
MSLTLGEMVEKLSAESKLSPRETQLLKVLVIKADRTDAIAKHLGLSEHTVNNHLKSIFERTGTHSKAEILRRFISFMWEGQL